jgi:hypothetical protein
MLVIILCCKLQSSVNNLNYNNVNYKLAIDCGTTYGHGYEFKDKQQAPHHE